MRCVLIPNYVFIHCMSVHTQSCLTLCNPGAYEAPLSMQFFQARILEWVAISYSRESS